MLHKLIELPSARLAIARVDTGSRQAARAGCARLIDELSRNAPAPYPFISKSHSQQWIAVGISAHAGIGVDVEVARPRARLAKMADWLNLDCEDSDTFFSHWTLRESMAKCVGGSVLEEYEHETELRAAIRSPDELLDAGGFCALCGKLEGGIYYALVLKQPAFTAATLCA